LYGLEICSFAVWEDLLRVSENGVVGTFGPKRDEVTRGWKNCTIRRLKFLSTLHKILLGRSNQKDDKTGGACSTHGR
jgi:hypothetical protein